MNENNDMNVVGNPGCKIVYDARVARRLLKRGHAIIDIKPDKYDKDRKRSVFMFDVDDTLIADLIEAGAEYSKPRTQD